MVPSESWGERTGGRKGESSHTGHWGHSSECGLESR